MQKNQLLILDKLGWKKTLSWYMLSNVVRIIQKIALTPTFGLCLSTQKLWFYFPTSTPSSLLQRANLSFATLESYIACLGAKVFKFPSRLIFGGGWTETKTGSSSDSLVIRKMHDGVEKHLLFKVFLYYIIVIFQTVLPRIFFLHNFLLLQFITKYFTLFHIVTTSIFHNSVSSSLTTAGGLICFITPPYSYTKMSVRISGIGRCYSRWKLCSKSLEKRFEGNKHFFFFDYFAT